MAIVPVGLSWFVFADVSSCKLSHRLSNSANCGTLAVSRLHEAVAMNLADRRPLEMWVPGTLMSGSGPVGLVQNLWELTCQRFSIRIPQREDPEIELQTEALALAFQ